jgi:hypothetical protein
LDNKNETYQFLIDPTGEEMKVNHSQYDRKKSEMRCSYCHSRENGNPETKEKAGFLLSQE